MNAPIRLFKYFTPERVSVLDSRLMRYTQLGAFNDPFEGRPEVTGLLPKTQFDRLLEEVRLSETEQSYDTLADDIKANVSSQLYAALIAQALTSQSGKMRETIEGRAPSITASIHRTFDERVGILCMSEVEDSLLIWAHYAASDTGFVLEFNGQHAYFNAQRGDQDEFYRLRRVLYRDTRPSGSLSSTVVSRKEHPLGVRTRVANLEALLGCAGDSPGSPLSYPSLPFSS